MVRVVFFRFLTTYNMRKNESTSHLFFISHVVKHTKIEPEPYFYFLLNADEKNGTRPFFVFLIQD